jgi:oligopeptide transport system permease protein
MGRYALRHFITSVITLLVVITATFFLMQAVPGNPMIGNSERISPEQQRQLLEKYGYDQPVTVQFVHYVASLIKGDMGLSIVVKAGDPVTTVIAEHAPLSFGLGGIAIAIAIFMGIPLGLLAARWHNSLYDRTLIFVSSFGVSIPSFIMTVALMLVFGVWLRILPVAYLTDWKSYLMPVFGLGIYPACRLARLTRTCMLDVIDMDYIRTAEAKGLSTARILFKHAFRNAMLPVICELGPMIAGVLTGSFVVEKVFAIKGIGTYFVSSISSRDYPLIMGVTIFFAAILILCNYVVDLLYSIVDPRIKVE